MFNFFKSAVVLSVVFCGAGALVSPAFAAADTVGDINKQLQAAAGAGGANLGQPQDPRSIAVGIIRAGYGLLGVIFTVMTIYAGFLWMTAGGNEENVTKAKKLLYQAVIGLAILLSAYSITIFVYKFVTGQYETSYFRIGTF